MIRPPGSDRSTDPPTLPSSRAFAALLPDLKRSARRLSRSIDDADDLVQDTLLRVWSRLAMGTLGASDAAPVTDLRAYAFATLRNAARSRGARSLPQQDGATEADSLPDPTGGVSGQLACAEARAALAALPADQQDLLRLRAIEGRSYAEIATMTGLPLGTVTSRLSRGRAALRKALGLPPGTPVSVLIRGS